MSNWGNIYTVCFFLVSLAAFDVKLELTSRVFKGRKEGRKGRAGGTVWTQSEAEKNLEVGEGGWGTVLCQLVETPHPSPVPVALKYVWASIYIAPLLKPTLTPSSPCPGLPGFRGGSSCWHLQARTATFSEFVCDILKVVSNPMNYSTWYVFFKSWQVRGQEKHRTRWRTIS